MRLDESLWKKLNLGSFEPVVRLNVKHRSAASRALDCILTYHRFQRDYDMFKDINPGSVNYREICTQCGQYYIVAIPDGGVVTRLTRSQLFKGPEGRMPQYWDEAMHIQALGDRLSVLTSRHLNIRIDVTASSAIGIKNTYDFREHTAKDEIRSIQNYLTKYQEHTIGVHKWNPDPHFDS
jgi:hypothetical protein